jgi:hypothetical protein
VATEQPQSSNGHKYLLAAALYPRFICLYSILFTTMSPVGPLQEDYSSTLVNYFSRIRCNGRIHYLVALIRVRVLMTTLRVGKLAGNIPVDTGHITHISQVSQVFKVPKRDQVALPSTEKQRKILKFPCPGRHRWGESTRAQDLPLCRGEVLSDNLEDRETATVPLLTANSSSP